MDYKKEFEKLSAGNGEYAEFNKRVTKTGKRVIGVRTPDMKKVIKKMGKGMDLVGVEKFLSGMRKDVYEDVALGGVFIAMADISVEERIRLTREWLEVTDSWAFIDGDISRVGNYDANKEIWDEFVDECLRSEGEFRVRFGVIFLMKNRISEVPEVFRLLRGVKHEGYYVKMGMAWTYAEAAVYDFRRTIEEMENEKIDLWTRRKALTKMVESYRFTAEEKAEIRELRGRIKE